MPDTTHLFKPGQAITRQASAQVTGGQLVYVSGVGTVAPTAGAVESWLGVAAFDAANGGQVTVLKGGVLKVTASGSITAGDAVIPAATGKVATRGADTNYARVVGVALTTATDGNAVEVDFVR